jgi:hypothetical protein
MINPCQEYLVEEFPAIPVPYIRSQLFASGLLYAPTVLKLREDTKRKPLPYTPKTRWKSKKGKDRQKFDEEIEKERAWLAELRGMSRR